MTMSAASALNLVIDVDTMHSLHPNESTSPWLVSNSALVCNQGASSENDCSEGPKDACSEEASMEGGIEELHVRDADDICQDAISASQEFHQRVKPSSRGLHEGHDRSFGELIVRRTSSLFRKQNHPVPQLEVNKETEEAIGARTRVRAFYDNSSFQPNPWQLPVFRKGELIVGRFLGQGAFSVAEEVRAFKVMRSSSQLAEQSPSNKDAINDKESRMFMADHCLRESGDARYAIKHLRKDVSKGSKLFWDGIADLIIETRFLGSLEHPNIIKLRGVASGDPYTEGNFVILDRLYDTLQVRISKWRLSGKRIKSFVGRLRDFQGIERLELQEERLVAAFDLSAAIEYLHERKICHRDIKPDNIGFDVRGDIKIFDFGLARELTNAVADTSGLYKLTRMCGSLRYMAPENALGAHYNLGCDVYSFCILLWQMLSCKVPFQKVRSEEKFFKDVFTEGLRPPIPSSWSKALRDMLPAGWTGHARTRLGVGILKNVLREEVVTLRDGDASDLDHKRRRSTYIYQRMVQISESSHHEGGGVSARDGSSTHGD